MLHRAKSEGRPGGFGSHVHVFPPWESTVAGPEGTSHRYTGTGGGWDGLMNVGPNGIIISYQNLFPSQADTLKERYQKIGDTKRNTPIEVLCENFPGTWRILYVGTVRF